VASKEEEEQEVSSEEPHEIENVIETSAETEKPARESLVERFKGLRRQRPQQQKATASTSSRSVNSHFENEV
jgi:hypothetical protein